MSFFCQNASHPEHVHHRGVPERRVPVQPGHKDRSDRWKWGRQNRYVCGTVLQNFKAHNIAYNSIILQKLI